ncbi:MAG: membrane protein insertase YidC [Acidobacteriia bacterium]|nr:membrane protein insertase YidC [Terriglobia bacterium]
MSLDQEKRVIVAFALSFVMLILWRVFFVKEPPPQPKKATTATTAPGQPAAAPAVSSGPQAKQAASRVALPVTQGNKAEDIMVENDLYRVTFSTQGAVVKSWVLKRYRDAKDNLLDTVDVAACQTLGFPMSVSVSDAALKTQLNQAMYVAEAAKLVAQGEPAKLSGTQFAPPVNLTFTYSDGKIQAKKQFSFGDSYAVKAEVSAFDGQHYLPIDVAWPGGFGDHTLAPSVIESVSQVVYGSLGDLNTLGQGKVKEARVIPGPLQLAGLEDKYFADIFLPDAPDQVAFRVARQEWSPPDWTEKEKPRPLTATLVETQPKPLAFRLFVAPKDLEVLKSVNPPLDSLVDFGWFSVVAKPLFIALRYIYDHWIHNYGWAIILLTVLINLAMFPLKLKSLRSAQEMQRVSPIIKGIQDKYKQYKFNDPRKQKMNEEVMKVYSEHHINPLGSCLPMLLQLPFLYGFYRVLDLAIELRHAPWTLWIKDLSAQDPIYILPSVIVVTQFILQRMTPMATVDPAQQRMMMIMPLVFGFMFFRFPSGMVLYWLTGNIVGIAQQLFINRHMRAPDPLLAPRKPAVAKE